MTNRVGKYELIRKIATGGMAEVFLAKFDWARGLEKRVVVKRILYHLAEDPTFIDMFFTEAQLASQLNHPNIAQIIEFGESDGVYFLAMEYVDGPSLRALAGAAQRGGGGLPFPHSARIAAFCCEALAHAHELKDPATEALLNLVHRDVSPDNILISKTGAVKLVDFGIAKAATQSHHTKTGLVKGKLAYMSPEQLRAEPLDRRADVFALGVVLYELVTGCKPFEAPSEITLIHAMLYEDMTPLRKRRADVPEELERIINKALERDRDRRYPDCRAMHSDLEEYLLAARHPVSALQVAELVEQYRPLLEGADGNPPMATPNRSANPARTPEPWRAERTPADGATAQMRKPLLKTGTDGGVDSAPPASSADRFAPGARVERTEVVPRSGGASTELEVPQLRVPAGQHRRSGARNAAGSAPRWRRSVLVGAGLALLLFVGAIAFMLPLRGAKADHAPLAGERIPGAEVATQPVVPPLERGGAPSVANPPEPTGIPKAGGKSVASSVPPPFEHLSPPPMIELIADSQPRGVIKLFVGGKQKAKEEGKLSIRLPPGQVEIEASGNANNQPFSRRERITLELGQRQKQITIHVSQVPVVIRSAPAAFVKIDGAINDETPCKVMLFEGAHSVRFQCLPSLPQCAGLADETKTVTVRANATNELTQLW